ncbi:MAG: hypothetical protein KAW09_00425, partial [Thermoplasmata archaeon]|nr:hypothetical protein [Thermoplasmata archaeon]
MVTSHEFNEYMDGNTDWNGDGDSSDDVSGYYAIDPTTGNCRENAVNIGVYGWYPRNTGVLLTPGYTWESNDRRDWNGDGDTSDTVLVYHDIETTWAMKGPVYTSYTFTASVPSWGFGGTAIYGDYGQFQTFPLTFGSSWYRYVGSAQGYYHTMVSLVGEDDGNRQTLLPAHFVGLGMPSASPGGQCIQIYTGEYYAYRGGIRLYGGIADANGDGDQNDYWYNTVFCPEETGGGGNWIVEETSKFAKGLYRDPIPVINMGYVYYSADGTAGGLCIMPYFWYDSSLNGDDVDGDLIGYQYHYYHNYYWIQFTKPDFEIIPGSLDWVFTGDVQPGGTVMGTFDLINTGGINIKIQEDKGIENDKGFKLQGLSARDRIGPDGVIEPQE